MKRNNQSFELFRRNCAAIVLQRFYHHYIKWERDERGWPIDPILKESFPPERTVRILYQTKLDISTEIYQTRVQYFDIETLWESLKMDSLSQPINPITNTSFTLEQYRKILNKAKNYGYITDNDIGKILNSYSQDGMELTSKYEMQHDTSNNLILNLLPYYALIGDTDKFDKIILENLEDIKSGILNIDYCRTPGITYGNACGTMSLINLIGQCMNGDTQSKALIKRKQLFDLDLESQCLSKYINKYNALQACCITGNLMGLSLLLQLGADLQIVDNNLVPLHLILLHGNINLVQTLVFYGASEQADFYSEYGTPLELAGNYITEMPELYGLLLGGVSYLDS